MPKLSTEERKLVQARLAMQEVAALTNKAVELTEDRDKELARLRICKHLYKNPTLWQENNFVHFRVDATMDAAIKQLRDADLNINFQANEFFESKKFGTKYMTKFEKMRTHGAPMGSTRNDVEMKMFRYAEKLGIKVDRASAGEIDATGRIERFGDLTSPDFRGVIRPRYCSVNFAGLIDGMGAQWGRSHFVLAEFLKPNMTFIHTDSFDDVASARDVMAKCANSSAHVQGTKMATYHHMTRLVANMAPPIFDLLMDVVDGKFALGQTYDTAKTTYRFGSTAYIEGHVHAELPFSYAFKKIRICNDEANRSKSVRKNLQKFLNKFNMTVEYFD